MSENPLIHLNNTIINFNPDIVILGHVDSLNVSVATAILAYEVVRQRKS